MSFLSRFSNHGIHSLHQSKLLCSTMLNSHILSRRFAHVQMKTEYASAEDLSLLRNIGISAHIDSGKTTTTERILFYTGRIKEIHEVRGKDGVGAKMDSMELEREKGITIKSAATHTEWGNYHINIIDTPGHVDFTIEVERALQVLDGAIMLVCASSGVQSQTITVDRQMRRYSVPRICFINKCDRTGADPYRALDQMRNELGINAAFVQLPIGLEEFHEGVIDLIEEKALYFDGPNGDSIRTEDIPTDRLDDVAKYRMKLLESLGEVDEEMELLYLEEEFPDKPDLKECIRRTVVANKFVPVFVGSAYKNKGVQPMLDGVIDYLPSPLDINHFALDPTKDEEDADRKVPLGTGAKDPLLFLAFKLEENQFGQLTWVRVYQGTLKKGCHIVPNNGAIEGSRAKKTKLNRIVRLHSEELQDISVAQAGDICAMFGVHCASGTTFGDGKAPYVISDLHVPQPVVSLAVKPKNKADMDKFGKAFERFMREDPTFRVEVDEHTGSCIFSGMGELHLQIYIERIQREYGVSCEVGRPRVNYKESITRALDFDYLHKKQTGGAGQYARIIGRLEPMEDTPNAEKQYEFANEVVGTGIPPQYIKSVDNGFKEMIEKGPMVGGPIVGLRVVLQDGVTHDVDSSDYAFRNAAQGCFRSLLPELGARVSEPYMTIEIMIPDDCTDSVIADLAQRDMVIDSISHGIRSSTIRCHGSLDRMFGYATDLRSLTQGKGEFSMEYKDHQFVPEHTQPNLIQQYKEFLAAEDNN